ncbi:MAG: response regulator [Deltaproteobacteria bacterium]|nr:response regulator [Deltaproteobacteria bacterium]
MSSVTIKVLVVDDDPTNVDLLSDLCRVSGYGVVTANSGEMALEVAKKEKPDLILLDVMMPGMDGYEVLGKVKVDVKLCEIPVILVTAVDEAEGKMRGLGAGAAEFVHKPFRTLELQQRIKNVIELNQAKRHLRDAEVELMSMRATDPVTGVGNFQRLAAVLEYEFGRAHRYSRPLSVGVIADESIDALLSTGGREFADKMLIQIAQTIRDEVREVDRIFRVDMAEFVVVFPETPGPGARIAIDRIIKTVAQFEAETGHHPDLFASIASLPNEQFKRGEDLFRAINVGLAEARKNKTKDPVVVEFQTFS